MISVLVCSRNGNPEALIKNISTTCGLPVEVKFLNNKEGQLGLGAAYNFLIPQCSGQICCFLHDDIFFVKQDWGKELESVLLEGTNVGLVGVAGSNLLSKYPVPWWTVGRNFTFSSVIHQSKNGTSLLKADFRRSGRYPAVALDGVFLATRRENLDTIRFDTINFPGFHLYDLDISMQFNSRKMPVIVDCNIPIRHSSEGKYDRQWQMAEHQFITKWEAWLPFTVAPQRPKEIESALAISEGIYFAKRHLLIQSGYSFMRAFVKKPLQLSLYHTIYKLLLNTHSISFPVS
jgi:glycosyltransferase involved in cell wall biosynthesis